GAARGGAIGQLLGKTALPDPRLATDRQQPAAACEHVLERVDQGRKLALAADEHFAATAVRLRRARCRRRRADGIGRRILVEDRLLELLEPATRLDAELLDEHAPSHLVRLQRVGLTAAAVEREHQLAAEPLPQGMSGDEQLELRDEL